MFHRGIVATHVPHAEHGEQHLIIVNWYTCTRTMICACAPIQVRHLHVCMYVHVGYDTWLFSGTYFTCTWPLWPLG